MHKNGCGRGNGPIGELGGATVLRRTKIRWSSRTGGGSGSARARTHSLTGGVRGAVMYCSDYGDDDKSSSLVTVFMSQKAIG